MSILSEAIGGDYNDVVQTSPVVARKTLCLFAIISLTFGADKFEVEQWLVEENLLEYLTPEEKEFLQHFPNISEQAIIQMSWRVEALVVLVWALQLLDTLPSETQQFDITIFNAILPPFTESSVTEFISQVQLRNDEELFEMAAYLQEKHGKARCQNLFEMIEILQERHYAINWIVGYCQQAWDDITTDT